MGSSGHVCTAPRSISRVTGRGRKSSATEYASRSVRQDATLGRPCESTASNTCPERAGFRVSKPKRGFLLWFSNVSHMSTDALAVFYVFFLGVALISGSAVSFIVA